MQNFHFVGIEGVGTSAAAQILLSSGYRVSGSDLSPGSLSRRLYLNGATICRGHGEANLSAYTDTVVASAAIMENNPEIEAAKKRGLHILLYSELLGWLMSQKTGLAVTGTHGKTTTSGLLAYALSLAEEDPSFVIGGDVPQLQGNGRRGDGRYFVAEACEYKKSFLHLTPKNAIITNVELDHLDYYDSFEQIQETFAEFSALVPSDGVLVVESKVKPMIRYQTQANIITYSLSDPEAQWQVDILGKETYKSRFIVKKEGQHYGEFETALAGEHNIANCLSVIALCDHLKVNRDAVKKAVAEYKGAKRRFDIVLSDPVTIIDDYAHHPTEIKAVLSSTRERYPESRIWAIFQPHQASRTYHLLDDFGLSFGEADEVIVTDIYYARDTEEDRQRVSSADLVSRIRAENVSARYIAQFENIVEFVQMRWQPNDVILCMGAGSISKFTHSLPRKIDFRQALTQGQSL